VFKAALRKTAIDRGIDFIYNVARDSETFAECGSNLLLFFFFIASTSADPDLKKKAGRMAKECFNRWRRTHASIPRDADASLVTDFVLGLCAAKRLGVSSNGFKKRLQKIASGHEAEDYLWFDPTTEAPPADVPEPCDCGTVNERGRQVCSNRKCKATLSLMSRYKLWSMALAGTYCGERYGVMLGARYRDTIKWLPFMRPYHGREGDTNPDFYYMVYAVTHIVYTLNDYGRFTLSPEWLPQEFKFLKDSLGDAVSLDDPDMVGEILDSLIAFGIKDHHPLFRGGVNYLLSKQNADGSWGDVGADIYSRYHATWAAIDGLRAYAWRGERISFQRLKPFLERLNNS
jgi:hypothetical protein